MSISDPNKGPMIVNIRVPYLRCFLHRHLWPNTSGAFSSHHRMDSHYAMLHRVVLRRQA